MNKHHPARARKALAKLKARSTVAAGLADPKFAPKTVPAKKGKRAYKRKPKHEV